MPIRRVIWSTVWLLPLFPLQFPEDSTAAEPPISFEHMTTYENVHSPVLGDFDGDGDMDLAQLDSTRTVSVSVNVGRGDGTFEPPVSFLHGTHVVDPTVADLNNDGLDDFVAIGSKDGQLYVLLGHDEHTLVELAADVVLDPAWNAPFFVVVDMNEDRYLDVILGDPESDSLRVAFGLGDGSFTGRMSIGIRLGALGMEAADFNGDGLTDLLLVGRNTLQVILASGPGVFLEGQTISLGPPIAVASDIADFNDDGLADVAVAVIGPDPYANEHYGAAVVLEGLGDGTFLLDNVSVDASGAAWAVATGDLNGDGLADAVFSRGGCDGMLIRVGGSPGASLCQNEIRSEIRGTTNIIATGDINRDGLDDLFVVQSSMNGTNIELWLNRGVSVPVEVQDLTASLDGQGVLLQWRLTEAAASRLSSLDVQRGSQEDGPFYRVNEAPLAPERFMRFQDTSPLQSAHAWYRLLLNETDGSVSAGSPLRVPLTSRARAALHSVHEDHDGDIQITYSIAQAEDHTGFAIYDVLGRLVWARVVSHVSTGEHRIIWSRQSLIGVLVPRGVYFIKMSSGRYVYSKKMLLR